MTTEDTFLTKINIILKSGNNCKLLKPEKSERN